MTTRLSCSNARCENGWVSPPPSYIDHYSPLPTRPDPDASPGVVAEFEKLLVEVNARRAAHENTVYPCKTCRPAAFYRWAGGHFAVGHDASDCSQCVDVRRQRLDLADLIPAPDPGDDGDDWTKNRADLR